MRLAGHVAYVEINVQVLTLYGTTSMEKTSWEIQK